MKKLLLVGLLALFLSGCGEPKKINMVEYGFKEEGTLYVKKVDAISSIYEDVRRRSSQYDDNGYDYTRTSICIDFAYDGQKKTFCNLKYEGKEVFYYYFRHMTERIIIDDQEKLIKQNIDNLTRLEMKLHQIAGDHSVFDSLSELISKFK